MMCNNNNNNNVTNNTQSFDQRYNIEFISFDIYTPLKQKNCK